MENGNLFNTRRLSATAEHEEHLFRQCSAAPTLTQAPSHRDPPQGPAAVRPLGQIDQITAHPAEVILSVSLLLPGELNILYSLMNTSGQEPQRCDSGALRLEGAG